MTKLEGEFCPICSRKNWCYCRCNYCLEQLNKGWLNRDGVQVINSRTNRPIPHDMYNNPHQDCMKGGTHGKGYFKNGVWIPPRGTPPEEEPAPEKSHDLHEYMRRHAKLEGKDWILYVDDKRTGFVIDREVVV